MPDLAEALSLFALVAATLEYAILIRNRGERRDATTTPPRRSTS